MPCISFASVRLRRPGRMGRRCCATHARGERARPPWDRASACRTGGPASAGRRTGRPQALQRVLEGVELQVGQRTGLRGGRARARIRAVVAVQRGEQRAERIGPGAVLRLSAATAVMVVVVDAAALADAATRTRCAGIRALERVAARLQLAGAQRAVAVRVQRLEQLRVLLLDAGADLGRVRALDRVLAGLQLADAELAVAIAVQLGEERRVLLAGSSPRCALPGRRSAGAGRRPAGRRAGPRSPAG